jgi:hypothetical protein
LIATAREARLAMTLFLPAFEGKSPRGKLWATS